LQPQTRPPTRGPAIGSPHSISFAAAESGTRCGSHRGGVRRRTPLDSMVDGKCCRRPQRRPKGERRPRCRGQPESLRLFERRYSVNANDVAGRTDPDDGATCKWPVRSCSTIHRPLRGRAAFDQRDSCGSPKHAEAGITRSVHCPGFPTTDAPHARPLYRQLARGIFAPQLAFTAIGTRWRLNAGAPSHYRASLPP
jgi:hypothetical protein